MRENIIGRKNEIERLKRLSESGKAEFVALYGRRRVGKTFLINEYFEDLMFFHLTALENSNTAIQLKNFAETLSITSNKDYATPVNWMDAFLMLRNYIEKSKDIGHRKVIFIDELPWIDRPKSDFISAFDHFWNSYASLNRDLMVIVCGSATSWMMNKLINNHGGLHNRLTCQIYLRPFNLAETESFLNHNGIVWNKSTIAETYMIFGGIPYYLSLLDRQYSLASNVDNILFRRGGELRNEFRNLYASLFERPESYLKVIDTLNNKHIGLTRDEISEISGVPANGKLTKILSDLESCDFIRRSYPFEKKHNNCLFQLVDFFTLFHYRFINGKDYHSEGYWSQLNGTPSYNNWCGLAFEMLILSHQEQVRKALGISGILCDIYSWRSKEVEDNTQIDLVFSRADKVVNLCEIKHYNTEFVINKSYCDTLEKKIYTFKNQTATRKNIMLTFISLYGLKKNSYSYIVNNEILIEDLFAN